MLLTEEHIARLVEQYGNMILRLSYTYLKNIADAEDTVQDIFLKIVEKMPDFHDETHEKSWIIRTTINTCKNKLKLFWNKHVVSMDAVKEMASLDQYHENSDVLQAVMALPKKYRVIVYIIMMDMIESIA